MDKKGTSEVAMSSLLFSIKRTTGCLHLSIVSLPVADYWFLPSSFWDRKPSSYSLLYKITLRTVLVEKQYVNILDDDDKCRLLKRIEDLSHIAC